MRIRVSIALTLDASRPDLLRYVVEALSLADERGNIESLAEHTV